MKWLSLIFSLSLAVLFVGTSFTAVFGAGRALNEVLRTYVFGVEYCEYVPVLRKDGEFAEPTCKPNTNRAKENVADGLAMLLVGAPVAIISFRNLKKNIKNGV